MVADSGQNISRDKQTLRPEKVNIEHGVSYYGATY
jgi:hypothetical protein